MAREWPRQQPQEDVRPPSGLEIVEQYGAWVSIVLVLSSPLWFWDLMMWAIDNWPVQR